MVFRCLYCNQNYGSQGAVTKHQKACKSYQEVEQKARHVRQTLREAKKRKLDQKSQMQPMHAQSQIDGPSSHFAPNLDLDSPMNVDSTDNSIPPSISTPTIDVEPSIPANRQPLPLQPTQTGRPQRNRRCPKRYIDRLPEAPAPITDATDQPASLPANVIAFARDSLRTACNSFNLLREYLYRPSHDPDAFVMASDLAKCPMTQIPQTNPQSESTNNCPANYHPPPINKSASLLSSWQNTGSQLKSDGELDRLVDSVLLNPNFNVNELHGFAARRENQRSDAADTVLSPLDGFRETEVEIEVPSGDRNVPSGRVKVPGLHYRPLTSVIRSMFAGPLAPKFHLFPYKLFHQIPSSNESSANQTERVYSELYDSDAFIQEHDKVQRAQLPPDDLSCKREKVVAALMFWSDQTHLANFGTAKLWPVYMFLGNLTKYIRAEPKSGACEHVAYLPPLSDSVQDFLSSFHKRWRTQKKMIVTHCRRELFHAAWKILLDDDFLHAYRYGIVIKCFDGIERRVYPRIFTYSADYPEKQVLVLIATICDNGICPCPRCLVRKEKLNLMGLIPDLKFRVNNVRKYLCSTVLRARDCVYKLARSINSKAINGLLFETSSVPTENAFVNRLGNDFELSRMVVVDFMHEFELGVWRNIFTHLIRILYAVDPNGSLIVELNRRFREIPTFGSGTIRRFASNASEMKKLAARDFEDLLQCSIPVFEGLLQSKAQNAQLMTLLFRTAEWHGFAKLRLHTESSLNHLNLLTRELGQLVRQFCDTTCSEFTTVDLPREVAARNRRKGKKANKKAKKKSSESEDTSKKELNIFTYKWHALGDYVSTIRLFGGTDSFSTQVGELAHCLVKRLYGLTNKKSAAKQIAKRYRRREKARIALQHKDLRRRVGHKTFVEENENELQLLRYHITKSRNNPIDLYSFVKNKSSDPAFKGFIPKLQTHLLGRLIGQEFDGDDHEVFTDNERNSVRIDGNRIYMGHICRVNYTTYDVRRGQDVINPTSHPDIMLQSPETGEKVSQYWYARVIGIFHAMVWTTDPRARQQGAQHMDFLWVRWFGVEPDYQSGFKCARLPKIGFVESTDEYAFGFVDPALVVRGCHLIPNFSSGRTDSLLPCENSRSRILNQKDTDDWTNYYVGIFVDRDMLLRHFGGGIGHFENTPNPDPSLNNLNEEEVDEEMDTETFGAENDRGNCGENGKTDHDGQPSNTEALVINSDSDEDDDDDDDDTDTDDDDDDDDDRSDESTEEEEEEEEAGDLAETPIEIDDGYASP